ncbi:MAG: LytTR family transcriptional regulator DNA-binding domain-containing protein [Clostridiales bacterium]|nr:LytTR family transcriptional regulator DNA-binding domain-containing protein [Clostridiales bacterium]
MDNIIHAIENNLNDEYPLIVCQRDNVTELLSQRDITRVYVEARRVRICAGKEVYESNKSLSFLEQQLNPDRFIRISRFEIANIRKIACFDFSTAGTVYIRFDDGSVTWAARRYVRAIQQALDRIEAGRE